MFRFDPILTLTGHYFHQPSGMNLAMYRAYSPTLGRWIGRDPIGESGGINLYGYVSNDPVNLWDPLGLLSSEQCAALRKLLERERQFGTQPAALMSGNTFGDNLLSPFNSTNVPNLSGTKIGVLDLDWFTDLTVFSIGRPFNYITTPLIYEHAKAFWTGARLLGRWPIGNWLPYQDIGERNAVLANMKGLHYADIFDQSYLDRECPDTCKK